MKNILVTGGSGFIGSHLCQKLLDKGFSVISIDNFSRGLESEKLNQLKILNVILLIMMIFL